MAVVKRGKRYGVSVFRHGRKEWIGTFDTRTEAKQVEREEQSKLTSKHKESAGDFLLRWAKEYPRQKKSTQQTYDQLARRFARDLEPLRLGNRIVVVPQLQLGQITRPIARAYVQKRPNLHQTLRAAYNDALRDGLVRENPFSNLGLKQSRGRKDIKALTEEEVAQLAECAVDEYGPGFGLEFSALITVAAYTALRPSELYALEWDWINFESREIEVRKRTYKGETDIPKSNVRRRVILPPPAAEALRSLPRDLSEARVFSGKRGGPLTAPKQSIYWRPVAARFEADLPPARAQELREARGGGTLQFYELRHACATILLERGLDARDVAVQLGHKDGGRLVETTYGHPDQNRSRDRLRRAFDPKPNLVPLDREASEVADG